MPYIDIAARATLGVCGYIKFVYKVPSHITDGNGPRILSFSAGDGTNVYYMYRDTGGASGRVSIFSSNGLFVSAGTQTLTDGVTYTVAFAFGPNFGQVRMVGQSLPTADTSVTWVPPTKVVLGHVLSSPTLTSSWMITEKLALKFGAVDSTVFNDMYTLAQAA
jgi:hypothetical protein